MNFEWKPIIGYENIYKINDKGSIINCKTKQILSPIYQKRSGYYHITLCKDGIPKIFRLHRLVALHFLEKPKKKRKYINHKNGNKLDNSIENLEWCTAGENLKHAYSSGIMKKRTGEDSPVSKLKWEDVNNIRKELENNIQKNIAKKYNVHQSLISNIKNNKIWAI